MQIDFFPQLYADKQYARCVGGLAIWHVLRAIDPLGSGCVVIAAEKLRKLLKIHESTLKRWLSQGAAAGLFVYRRGSGDVWARYRSWKRLLNKAPLVFQIPVQALKHGAAAATLAYSLAAQRRAAHASRQNPEGKFVHLERLVEKLSPGRVSCLSRQNGKMQLNLKVRGDSTDCVQQEPFPLLGTNVKPLQIPDTFLGQDSPTLFHDSRFLCLRPGYAPYGANQETIAQDRGICVRTVRRHQRRSEAAKDCRFIIRRLSICAGARTVFSQEDFEGSNQLPPILDRIRSLVQQYGWVKLKHLSEEEQYELRLVQKIHVDYDEALFELSQRGVFPSKSVLLEPEMRRFVLIPTKINVVKPVKKSVWNAKTWRMEDRWYTDERGEVSGYAFLENLTNVYGAKALSFSPNEGYYRQAWKRHRRKIQTKGGRLARAFEPKLAQRVCPLALTELELLAPDTTNTASSNDDKNSGHT